MLANTNRPAPPSLFNRTRLAQRAANAWTGEPNFVNVLVADDLGDRLSAITRIFKKALIIGPDARALPIHAQSASASITFERAATLVETQNIPLLDPEALTLPHTDYDLIVSLLDLQTVNDVPGFLTRIHRHLSPDGLMMAAAIGGRSFTELRAAWLAADVKMTGGAFARVAPFMDVRDAGSLLQRAGFALPVTDVESHRVRYADPLALMRDIKQMGAANPMREGPTHLATPALLVAAAQEYAAIASDPDGRIYASLEILWMSGWAPHESQQKPLAPGSAKTRLTDVLGNKANKTQ